MPYYKRITYQEEAIENKRSGIIHTIDDSVAGYGDFTACGKNLKKGFMGENNWRRLGTFTEFNGEITCKDCSEILDRKDIKFVKEAV